MSKIGHSGSGDVLPTVYLGPTMIVSVTDPAAASDAMSGTMSFIRIVCTVACHIKIGDNPTATASDAYLPAGVIEYIAIRPGQKVSFLKATGESDGTGYVTTCM